MKYSVLMSVYEKENPEYFKTAVESMLSQTVFPDEFVLVCDGTLPSALNCAIEEFQRKRPELFQVLRLKENHGLGPALNAGVRVCRNPLIARMDSDDIAEPSRCELQLRAFKTDKKLSLLSGSIAEFETNPLKPSGYRILPLSHEEIFRFAKKRNPMNHMAVMMKKSAVLAAGNYGDFKGMEDYELWVRMLQQGFKTGNLEQILVYARVGNGMMTRRGGKQYACDVIRMQTHFWKTGFITFPRYIMNCLIRLFVSVAPAGVRGWFYKKRLRNRECKGRFDESETI